MQNSRQIAVKALSSISSIIFSRDQLAQLPDPQFEIAFLDLGMDSLGYMELSIWLETELGMVLSESQIEKLSSLNALALEIESHLGKSK